GRNQLRVSKQIRPTQIKQFLPQRFFCQTQIFDLLLRFQIGRRVRRWIRCRGHLFFASDNTTTVSLKLAKLAVSSERANGTLWDGLWICGVRVESKTPKSRRAASTGVQIASY